MTLKSTIFVIVAFVFSTNCYPQDIDWSSTSHWKIYSIKSKASFGFPVDSLQFLKSDSLSDTVLLQFLSHARIWPTEKYSLWMGSFLLSFVTAEHKTQKLIVSSYGGFFYDPSGKRYYELPDADRESWFAYLNDAAEKISNAQ